MHQTSSSHGDEEPQDVSVEANLIAEQADREIRKAVTGRGAMARKYLRRMRRRNPQATPEEVIAMLERHYVTAISVAGAAVTVGTVALEIGISLIPGGGAAAAGGKAVAKKAGKTITKEAARHAMKAAGKQAAIGAAKNGAQRATALIPAGDAQLQFEITALFALALADIHGLELDKEQAHALVYGLSNGRVSQQQIATMATDLAKNSPADADIEQSTASGRKDLAHWANTLAEALPGGQAQSLVRGVQTGVLDDVRAGLSDKHQAAMDYGAGALVSGATKFVFGREVVEAARTAFAAAPPEFPAHLDIPSKPDKIDDEPNRALEALEDAARAVTKGLSSRATTVGTGVATAADAVSRPFRSIDLDGDGVPDEPQALAAIKGVATAAGTVTRPFRKGDRNGDEVADEPKARVSTKRVGSAFATLASRRRGRQPTEISDDDASPDQTGPEGI